VSTLTEVFRVLNGLEADGVIQKYAVAGAMAFLFYTEPARTYDLDVFVFLPPQQGLIFSMEPLYRELRQRGYSFDAEHVMIEDTPVQFLPAYNPLAEEAVEDARIRDYDGVPVRVVGPEYLAALAYQTGGHHRLLRVASLMDEGLVDRCKFDALMARHGIYRRHEG
jgi:hypothetical protein